MDNKVYAVTTLSDLGDGAEVSVSVRKTHEEAKNLMKELVEEYVEENDLPIDSFYVFDDRAEYCSLEDGIFVIYEIHECYC